MATFWDLYGGIWFLIAGYGKEAGAHASTQKTLTVVIKFDFIQFGSLYPFNPNFKSSPVFILLRLRVLKLNYPLILSDIAIPVSYKNQSTSLSRKNGRLIQHQNNSLSLPAQQLKHFFAENMRKTAIA